jgi:hypothetical protein
MVDIVDNANRSRSVVEASLDNGSIRISLKPLKNNTGQVLSYLTGVRVALYNKTTDVLFKRYLNVITDSQGQIIIKDVTLVPGINYRVVVILATGEEGIDSTFVVAV